MFSLNCRFVKNNSSSNLTEIFTCVSARASLVFLFTLSWVNYHTNNMLPTVFFSCIVHPCYVTNGNWNDSLPKSRIFPTSIRTKTGTWENCFANTVNGWVIFFSTTLSKIDSMLKFYPSRQVRFISMVEATIFMGWWRRTRREKKTLQHYVSAIKS